MLSDATIDRLREALLAADYTLDPVMERLGEAGRAGLERNSTVPARRSLAEERDPQATFARLWVLQDAVSQHDARAALGAVLDPLLAAGLLAPVGTDALRATAALRPYGAEAGPARPAIAGWICHDLLPSLDAREGTIRDDFVLGVSPASTTLAQLAIRRPNGSALDLGTGCGVQSVHLAAHTEEVVATDLNPRALQLARITTRLSGVAADLRLGSLYEPVAGQTFDQIISNPPYVMSPPSDAHLTYREGALPGDELVRQVIVDGARHLNPDGTMQVLCNWAILGDQPWQERLAGWVEASGCDALILEREQLDPYEYVELWLADAGLKGAPDYAARYDAWLHYFDQLNIAGVGMGWVSLRNAGRATPDVRIESWPFNVHQPLGDALAAQHSAVESLQLDDAELLATRWIVHPDVVQETMGRPGAEDPEHLVLRQSYGLGRAREAGTDLAALVGACDGELSASEIIGAIAAIFEVDAPALTADLLPRVRTLVADGYLLRDRIS